MKRFAIFLTIVLTSLSLLAANAEAKRFGGGGSIGKQRSMSPPPQKSPAAAPQNAPAQPAAPQSTGSKWLGPLAGLAIGAGLGALFASMGMGEGMGMLLMLALGAFVLFFLFSMFRKKQPQAAMQFAGAGAPSAATEPFTVNAGSGSSTPVAVQPANIPADFPVDSFLRSAKTSFIRLQAANDRKDLNDIREYTTPEMFAEISMQLQERGDAPQQTDVGFVNAQLLEVVTENDTAIASVRLSGQLRQSNAAPEDFDEIWHVQKNLQDDRAVWLLAGIQQA
ncbi:MAG: Tim44-like domain-containing protein [Sideroxydans sp.]|jgi:predicted lipid-binding transport protein (Tim44 family)